MGDISASTVSASPLMLRRGCACGTRDSGDMRHSIEDWWVWAPRMGSATECAALIDLCRMKASLPDDPEAKRHVVRVVQMLTRLCR